MMLDAGRQRDPWGLVVEQMMPEGQRHVGQRSVLVFVAAHKRETEEVHVASLLLDDFE